MGPKLKVFMLIVRGKLFKKFVKTFGNFAEVGITFSTIHTTSLVDENDQNH